MLEWLGRRTELVARIVCYGHVELHDILLCMAQASGWALMGSRHTFKRGGCGIRHREVASALAFCIRRLGRRVGAGDGSHGCVFLDAGSTVPSRRWLVASLFTLPSRVLLRRLVILDPAGLGSNRPVVYAEKQLSVEAKTLDKPCCVLVPAGVDKPELSFFFSETDDHNAMSNNARLGQRLSSFTLTFYFYFYFPFIFHPHFLPAVSFVSMLDVI